MTIKFANNVSTTLANSALVGQTTMEVASVAGFPTLALGDYFYGTLTNNLGAIEIVEVTSIAGNVLTCVRGAEGTAPQDWATGATFEIRVTAAGLTKVMDATEVVEEVQTATSGQTVFTLTTFMYAPGENTLSVYLDGINQIVGLSYEETSPSVVTFADPMRLGALVKFTTLRTNGITTSSAVVTYEPAGAGAVATTVQSKLRESVSVLDFGAVPGGSALANRLALQAAFNANTSNVELDLCGGTYLIDLSLHISNTSSLTLKNGTIVQTVEAEDVLQCIGEYHSKLTFENISLTHNFNTAASGSCFHVTSTVTNFNFFRWIGGNLTGGYHGIKTNGSVWMAHFERIWALSPYSAGWYMPSSGSVVNSSQLGGSTTTKLYKCFVTDVQSSDPAYMIGSGYDTLTLEQCSADRCYNFGYFKASPLVILNCSSENIVNPPTGVVSGPHRFISIGSGSGCTINGFHVTFDAGFVVPAPGGGNVNSFIYILNTNNLYLAGIRGVLASAYYTLDQEGGTSFVNTALLGNGVRAIAGAVYRTTEQIPISARPNRTSLSGVTSGNISPTTLWTFEPGKNIYILTMSWAYGGATTSNTWLVYTDSTSVKGTTAKLMSGPDNATSVTISIVGSTVVYTTTSNLISSWQAFNLSLADY